MDYIQHNRNRTFDWKTFFALSIFFFTALVNPRDFPIPNVPLIYPAFLFFLILTGPHKVSEGFRRTKFLCILLIIFWCYTQLILLIKGGTIHLGQLAYLLEPLLIFGAAGTATIRPGGTKAALWAMVFIITLSTAGGIWIYFIGEPVASWHSALHWSTGGNLLQGDYIRNVDMAMYLYPVIKINSGLSSKIFSFSYQLAVAILITSTAISSMRRSMSIKYLFLLAAFVILFVGVITNAERATVLSVSVGLLSFFLIKGKKVINLRVIIAFIMCILVVMALLNYSSRWQERRALHRRSIVKEKIYVRMIVIPIASISSVFFEPLGAGGMSDYYKDVARRVGWVSWGGHPVSSHNHFALIIMYTGIIGIFLTISLFLGLWKKIQYTRLSNFNNEEIFLATACITSIIHSLTHNAGFFKLEPATLIVFGLLWGATAKKIMYPRFNKVLQSWIF